MFKLITVEPINREIGKKKIRYIFLFFIDIKSAKFKGKFIISTYLTLILIAWNKKLYILIIF